MDSNHRHLLSESSGLPLNDPAVAGRQRIERSKSASKTDGFPLTDLPLNSAAVCGQHYSALCLPHPCRAADKTGLTGENRTLVAGVTTLRLSHSATANITGGGTPNRTEMIWASARRRDHVGYPATNLVDKKGIEPLSTGCRPVILPLNDLPMLADGCGGATRTHVFGL